MKKEKWEMENGKRGTKNKNASPSFFVSKKRPTFFTNSTDW
jgi:hypothetical protein